MIWFSSCCLVLDLTVIHDQLNNLVVRNAVSRMIAVLNCIVKHDMKVVWVDTYSIKFTYSFVKSRVIQRLDHRSSFFGEGSKHPVFSFFLSVYDLRVICILGVLKRNQRFILIDFKDTHITIYSL